MSFTIRLVTEQFAPSRQVVLRWGPTWNVDRGGIYTDGAWTFELDESEFPEGIEFKFVLAPGRWMSGDNRRLTPEECIGTRDYTEAQIEFEPTQELITERGAIPQRYFVRNLDPNHIYDVIVVGSGMGGGILASRLARAGKDVLVLEAGSYLFPTHVGNLPRRLAIGQFDKHVWSLWPDFSVRAYKNGPDSEFAGGQAFNLGGRSVFWGGLIPRQEDWELQSWPAAVREYLQTTGFADAEREMSRVAPDQAPFQDGCVRYLDDLFGDYVAEDAPMAVQYEGAAELSIPAGMFSTADLLMEDRLLPEAFPKPTVNLNFAVWSILRNPSTPEEAIGVTGWDLVAQKQRSFHGHVVVLSAGTLETAKIALQSGLGETNPKIGIGLTDHTIRYRHFQLPSSARLYDPAASAKVLLRHPGASVDSHAFDVVVEVGSNLNQGRYLDPNNLALERAARSGSMVCEIVFMHYADLNDENSLHVEGSPAEPVRVNVAPVRPSREDVEESDQLAMTLFENIGARLLAPDTRWLPLASGALGAVSHEVGTLRMASDETGVVDEDLRVLGFDNLFVCDNSVFPASPAANPSLTLAALALRLSSHLA